MFAVRILWRRRLCREIWFSRLNQRQQQIILLRYYEELSQAEVAAQMGISQMHVSRLERQALRDLQQILSN